MAGEKLQLQRAELAQLRSVTTESRRAPGNLPRCWQMVTRPRSERRGFSVAGADPIPTREHQFDSVRYSRLMNSCIGSWCRRLTRDLKCCAMLCSSVPGPARQGLLLHEDVKGCLHSSHLDPDSALDRACGYGNSAAPATWRSAALAPASAPPTAASPGCPPTRPSPT